MITVYTDPKCGKCKMLKKLLDRKQIEYKEERADIDALIDEGYKTIPVVELPNGKKLNFSQAWDRYQK